MLEQRCSSPDQWVKSSLQSHRIWSTAFPMLGNLKMGDQWQLIPPSLCCCQIPKPHTPGGSLAMPLSPGMAELGPGHASFSPRGWIGAELPPVPSTQPDWACELPLDLAHGQTKPHPSSPWGKKVKHHCVIESVRERAHRVLGHVGTLLGEG